MWWYPWRDRTKKSFKFKMALSLPKGLTLMSPSPTPMVSIIVYWALDISRVSQVPGVGDADTQISPGLIPFNTELLMSKLAREDLPTPLHPTSRMRVWGTVRVLEKYSLECNNCVLVRAGAPGGMRCATSSRNPWTLSSFNVFPSAGSTL